MHDPAIIPADLIFHVDEMKQASTVFQFQSICYRCVSAVLSSPKSAILTEITHPWPPMLWPLGLLVAAAASWVADAVMPMVLVGCIWSIVCVG